MKSLFLLRHAKSSWDDAALADHDRPLSPRGTRAARSVAASLGRAGTRPALVLCSSALRTRHTLDALTPVLGERVDVRIEAGLYGASAGELLDRLRRVAVGTRSVMVIGHNPGLHELAVDLTGDGDEQALLQLRTKFPTAALATLDLGDPEWAELSPGQARIESLVVPERREIPVTLRRPGADAPRTRLN